MKAIKAKDDRGENITITVENIPGRKRKAIVKHIGTEARVLAYFINDECAKEFEKIINNFKQ